MQRVLLVPIRWLEEKLVSDYAGFVENVILEEAARSNPLDLIIR
jgi:hypothetical protein